MRDQRVGVGCGVFGALVLVASLFAFSSESLLFGGAAFVVSTAACIALGSGRLQYPRRHALVPAFLGVVALCGLISGVNRRARGETAPRPVTDTAVAVAMPPPAPPELPHPHVRCSWLLPDVLGDLHLVEIHTSGIVTNTDYYEYGPSASSLPIRVEVDCAAHDVPVSTGDVVDAGGVALYVRSSGVIGGWTPGANSETVPVELAFEHVSGVDASPRTVAFVVSAVPAHDVPRSEMRVRALDSARELAAFVRARTSTAHDDAATLDHWSALLATVHSEPAQREWMRRAVDAYDAAMHVSESSYLDSAHAAADDPGAVDVRFNRAWSRLPAQEQQRRLSFLQQRWDDTHAVPEPNVRSGRWQPLGPYDPRPFDSRLVFHDASGHVVAPSSP